MRRRFQSAPQEFSDLMEEAAGLGYDADARQRFIESPALRPAMRRNAGKEETNQQNDHE